MNTVPQPVTLSGSRSASTAPTVTTIAPTTTAGTRPSTNERSDQLVRAAVTAFAAAGYAGTTTDDVARLAGVSQPYVIRLFGSKQKLFVAAIEHACGRIEQAFRDAAPRGRGGGTVGGKVLSQMREA